MRTHLSAGIALACTLAGCNGPTPGTETDSGTNTGDLSTSGISPTIAMPMLDLPAPSDTSFVTDDPDDDDTAPSCADANVKFEAQIPTVMLLIDQSGSMTEDFNGPNRWEAVYDSLLDPDDGIVLQLQSDIRFGMALYTGYGGDNRECPVLTSVDPGLDNYGAMESLFNSSEPEGETPTGESITAVVPTLIADPGNGAKVLVLATDGEPDTCAEPNPQNGQEESVAAAEAAFAQGIRTYVISVGEDVSDQHLQDMANAGAGVQPGDPDAPFYKANNPQALSDAFQQIVNGVRDCRFKLDGMVADGAEEECSVEVNDAVVPFNDPNGWELNDPSEIELVGDACAQIQAGEVAVKISCSCGGFIPTP